jgi:2-oxoglutarate dehydrogenase E2 component (dihydrolipoamide succinyltransferase)
MAVELKVPSLGESITEVQIGTWFKQEGDEVAQDDALVEIETDKTTVELPAPVRGVITKILLQQGAMAEVGDVVGYMEERGAGAVAAKQRSAEAKEEAEPTAEEKPAAAEEEPPAEPAAAEEKPPAEPAAEEKKAEPAPEPTPRPQEEAPAAAERPARPAGRAGRPPRLMPSARRALAEHGVEPDEVRATGPGGRLLKEDVLRHAGEGAGAAAEPEPGPPSRREKKEDAVARAVAATETRQEEVVPMTMLRRRIAERLVQAQQTAALLTTFNEVDMTLVMALRKQYQQSFSERYGIKLGFMSFFIKAVIEALKQVPEVNAEIRNNAIVFKNYYDIGVAIGGGRGLVVPVIRHAERLGFAELELKIADYAKRAQSGTLQLEELQGGTFTISNGGIYGSMLSTPIVNPPQSGILGMHAIQPRAVVVDDEVVVRPMMYIALTYDHRIIDGREAVTFLRRIKECIEQPSRILLEI